MLTLLRNPWSLELLRRRRDLIPGAIEEVLRLQSSVQFFQPVRSRRHRDRWDGHPKGAPIFFMYGAANRDPRRFPHPNEFDPERRDNQHVGWSSGIHTCFGGPLARLEVNTAVEVFLRRVENPRLVVDPPPYRPNQFFAALHLLIDIDGIKTEEHLQHSSSSQRRSRPSSARCRCPSRAGPGPGQDRGAGACHSDLHILEAPPAPGPADGPLHPRP